MKFQDVAYVSVDNLGAELEAIGLDAVKYQPIRRGRAQEKGERRRGQGTSGRHRGCVDGLNVWLQSAINPIPERGVSVVK